MLRFHVGSGAAFVVMGMLIAVAAAASAGEDVTALEFHVVNTSRASAAGQPVVVPVERLPREYRIAHLVVLRPDGEETPAQVDDLDGDGTPDELVFLASVGAGQRERYRVVAGSREKNAGPELAVEGRAPTLVNRTIRCRFSAEKASVDLLDAATGELWLESLSLRLPGSSGSKIVVRARGPVRGVVDRVHVDGSKKPRFEVVERFIAVAGEPGVDLRLIFRNLTDQEQPLPGWIDDKSLFSARMGPPIAGRFDLTEVVSVHKYRTTRPNLLWINPATETALGFAFHSPHWRWYGPTLWAGATTTWEGVTIHSNLAPPGHRPASGRHVHTEKNGNVAFGRLLAMPENPKHVLFRRMWWKDGRRPTCPVAGSVGFGFSVRLYRSAREETMSAFEEDVRRAVGMLTVLEPTGEEFVVAGAPEFLQEDFATLDRWCADSGVQAEIEQGRVALTSRQPDRGIAALVTRDFGDPTELRGRINALGEGTAVALGLENPADGTVHPLGRIAKIGSFRIDAGERINALGPRSWRLRATLVRREGTTPEKADRPLTATLDDLTLAWPVPPAPTILSPVENFPLTDISLSFAIRSEAAEQCERGYQFQVAEDADFSSIRREYRCPNSIRTSTTKSFPYRTYTPQDILPPGEYWLRVRSVSVLGEPGPWSEARGFVIAGADRAPQPLVRKVSPAEPLLLIPPQKLKSTVAMWDALPPEIQPLAAFDVSLDDIKDDPEGWLEQTRFPISVRLGHNITGHPELSYLEYLFARHPRIVGFTYAESIFPTEYAVRNIELAAKYGRYFGVIEGGPGYGINQILPGAHRGFYDKLATHGDYFLPFMKSQNPYSPLAGYVNLVGLWLAGRPERWAAETEFWMPQKLGIGDAQQKPVDWMPPLLMGLAYGAQAWRVETFISNKECRGWDPDAGRFDNLWTQALRPFFEDMLRYDLIPSRAEVLSGVKVAIQPEEKVGVVQSVGVEYYPVDLVNLAHHLDAMNRQWVPDNPGTGIVPVLPVLATDQERMRFQTMVRPEQLSSPEAIREILARRYPATENQAFAVRSGDTAVITNSIDDPRQAASQRFFLPLSKGPAESVEGIAGYHQYLILKQTDDRLFVHCNNYQDRQSSFTLRCRRPVELRFEPAEALVDREWDAEKATLVVTVRHDHSASVVRVFVE